MNALIPVVCHDFRNIVTGTLREVTQTGCELVSNTHTTGPVFPQKAMIMLNLLDEKSGKSINVRARLVGAKRQEGTWTYRIRWPELPEFLAA